MSVQRLFPGAQVTIGPWIDRGFYYDFDMPQPLTTDDLKTVKKEMQKIIKADLPFIQEEVAVVLLSTCFPSCIIYLNDIRVSILAMLVPANNDFHACRACDIFCQKIA